jgi:hypothetical protein
MAKEYHAQAAEHADAAALDIGNPPPWAIVIAAEHIWPRHEDTGARAA